jgi:hypothetical protein
MSFTFDQSSFNQQQKALTKEFEAECKSKINSHLQRVYAYVVPLTPVGNYTDGRLGGRLRRAWDLKPAQKTANGYEGIVFNNVNYSKHVEYGHRTRWGTGKATPKPGAKNVVEGQHFLEDAIKKAMAKEGR